MTTRKLNFYVSSHPSFTLLSSCSKFRSSFQSRTFRTSQSASSIQPGFYQHESRSPSTFPKLHLILSLVIKAAARKRWLLAAQEVHHGHLSSNSSIPGVLGTFRGKKYSQLSESVMNVQTFGHWKCGYRLKKKRGRRSAQILGHCLTNTHPKIMQKTHEVSCSLHNPFPKTFLL